jgi:hypothetical protein
MTNEQKVRAYDEAIERAKNYYNTTDSIADTELIELIFPELKESEDERIKNEIIKFLELPHPQFVGKRHQEKWIAWLEKQGNLADKVIKPKFHEGEWVVFNNRHDSVYQVEKIMYDLKDK